MPPPQTRHTSSLQLHPHTHYIVAPGFVDRPRRSDCTAGHMDGEAGWWTTSGNIGLPPLARVMGVGRQQQRLLPGIQLSQGGKSRLRRRPKANNNKASITMGYDEFLFAHGCCRTLETVHHYIKMLYKSHVTVFVFSHSYSNL